MPEDVELSGSGSGFNAKPLQEEISKGKDLEARANEGLVARYKLFQEKIIPKNDIVYHPCGSTDISPSVAFPGSRVINVDVNEQAMKAVKNAGFEAHTADAETFDPGPVNVLIMINPDISLDVPTSHIVDDGYALVNDYHGTATALHKDPQFDLTALIRKNTDGSLVYDTDDLDDFWQEIDSEEAFKNALPSHDTTNYHDAAEIVEAFTGKRANVLEEYKKLIAKAREEKRAANTKFLAQVPSVTQADIAEFGADDTPSDEETDIIYQDLLEDPDEAEALPLRHGGKGYTILTKLPRKKGIVDDILVFKKKPTLQEASPIASSS